MNGHDELAWAILFLAISFGIIVAHRPDMPLVLLFAGYVSGFVAVVFFSQWVQRVMW